MKYKNYAAIITGVLLLGAGCSSNNTAVTPGYVKDAASYGQPGSPITRTSTNYEPGYPAPAPVVTNTQSGTASGGTVAAGAVTNGATALPTKTGTTATSKTTTATKTTVLTASDAYLKTLAQYKNSGYYMQFSACKAMPGSLTLKRDARFMLDNRDNAIHKIAVEGKVFTLRPYQFVVTSVHTLGTNYITCDGGGSGVVEVQR